MAKVLHNHTAGNARATAAQRCRLVGVVITACVDHYRAALNVGHAEMWRRSGLRSFAAGIDGKYWHIALVTLALRPEMFAGVSRVVMSPRCHPSRWLAIWSVGGTAIRINVDMKTVVARRQLGSSGVIRNPSFVSDSSIVPIFLPTPLASIAFIVTVVLAA